MLKAFDTVKREELIFTLRETGLNNEIIKMIEDMYKMDYMKLFLEEMGVLERNRGIKQGCKISPVLFVLLMNRVIETINKLWKTEKGWNILMYADDTIMLAHSEEEFVWKMNVFKYEYKKLGLVMNEKKSEVMILGGGAEKKEKINGVPVVEQLKYLGVKLRNERNMM